MTDALYPMQLAVQGKKKMEWHDDWLTNVVKTKIVSTSTSCIRYNDTQL